MIIKTVQIGNPIIRAKAKPVAIKKNFAKATQKIVKDLIDSMASTSLIGMAAPQIGVSQRVFITKLKNTTVRKTKKIDPLRVFINPKIVEISKAQSMLMEGCGSLVNGQLFGPVKRPKSVTVQAYDEKGKKFILKATGLLAKCIQHEIDHLNGIVCLDKFMNTQKVSEKTEYIKKINKK